MAILNSSDIALLWRGAKPTEQLTFGFYGARRCELCHRRSLSEEPFELRIDNPGDRCSIFAPNTFLERRH